MTTKQKHPRSARLAAMHTSAESLQQVGAMTEKSMRLFDVLCLQPVVANQAREVVDSSRIASEDSVP